MGAVEYKKAVFDNLQRLELKRKAGKTQARLKTIIDTYGWVRGDYILFEDRDDELVLAHRVNNATSDNYDFEVPEYGSYYEVVPRDLYWQAPYLPLAKDGPIKLRGKLIEYEDTRVTGKDVAGSMKY